MTLDALYAIAEEHNVDFALLCAWHDFLLPDNKNPHVSFELERARSEIPAKVLVLVSEAVRPLSPEMKRKWGDLARKLGQT